MTQLLNILPEIYLILDFAIRAVFSARIIMRRLPVGVSLAWLAVIMTAPILGSAVYLLIGELRLGNRRAIWAKKIRDPFDRWLSGLRNRIHIDWSQYPLKSRALSELAESSVIIPAMQGNDVALMSDAYEVIDAIVADIDQAERTCHLEFYIWEVAGRTQDVAQALLRARDRGLVCRVLVDAVGSRSFLRSETAQQLREHGVEIREALPAGLIRMLFVRFDLRLHRKIVVIDGEIGYTGSLNLADPQYFKRQAGVGEWVDAMVRMTGPAVEGLAITFLEDWALESSESIERLSQTGDVHPLADRGRSVVHVVPSGPAVRRSAMDRVLLTAIYEAREELVITTPYFVPDESLLMALISAAHRGVRVVLVIPAKIDSKLVRFAGEAHQDELLEAGVEIFLFEDGLLHTKSVTIDGQVSLFGSLNLDPRSLHLNFEITLLIHCTVFCERLRDLQANYIKRSICQNLKSLRSRSLPVRFAVQVARLLGPLL